MSKAEWFGAQWDGAGLRLWAMRGTDVIAQGDRHIDLRSAKDQGFAQVLSAEQGLLIRKIEEGAAYPAEQWGDAPTVMCGEIGGREGWLETPFSDVPTKAYGPLMQVRGARVWIACGMRQADPADVMRGNETRISGLLAARPEFDGVVCLTGAQTQWARISAGELCYFQSFMTGELFSFMAQASSLHPLIAQAAGDMADTAGAEDSVSFDRAVEEGLTQPHRAFGRLAQLRASVLVGDLTPKAAAARLSGLLVGLELASAKPYWLGEEVVLMGAQAGRMARALESQGVVTRQADAEAALLAGLHRAWMGLDAVASGARG
jgi:2-dehydro-3-deoxygalactonokinase